MASESSRTLPEAPRLAVLGDSIISGLGSPKGTSYAAVVAERLGSSEMINLSRTTLTVDQTFALLPKVVAFRPDLVLLSVGGADGLVHPARFIEHALDRFGPKSWRGSSGLEPRVTFSRESKALRIRQKVTSRVKVTLKRVGIALSGGYRRVEPGPFREYLEKFGPVLAELDCLVVVVPPGEGDAKLFPGSNESIAGYRRIIDEVAGAWPNTFIVDPVPVLTQWEDFLADRVHYNPIGHEKVAEKIVTVLADAGALAFHA